MNRATVQLFVKGGIFPLYKPAGLRTMEYLDSMKDVWEQSLNKSSTATEMPKVGHGGVLDSFAHGILVVGIGSSCQNLGLFLNNCQKSYLARGKLGEAMDTDSVGGKLIKSMDYQHVTHEQLQRVIDKFRGNLRQKVPMYSNVKVKGIRMVDYATRGIYTRAKVKTVQIHSLNLLHVSLPYFEIHAVCSSGTYIRSLIRDIGIQLGTVAHTHSLCRVQQGPFKIGDTLTLQDCDMERVVRTIETNGERVETFISHRQSTCS